MDDRKRKMATQKAKQKALTFCKKCGSVMIQRMIAEKNGSKKSPAKFIKIYQCIVCRHWAPIL
jgi:hypothetical protein